MSRSSNETLSVGDLDFEVRRSNRRRSVQITVDRGGELVLSAPEGCPTATMSNFVREKKSWIYTKLAEKDARECQKFRVRGRLSL